MHNLQNNVFVTYFKEVVAFLITVLFLLSSCTSDKNAIREKAIYYHDTFGWYGPATFAIEDFNWTYFRVPASTDELLRHIDCVYKEYGENAFWGDSSYLKQEIKNNPDHFVSYSDSCFFYSQEYNGEREGVCVYSPKYLLETLGKRDHEEHIQIESRFHTGVYDENDLSIPFDYHLIDELTEKIKQAKEYYSKVVVRTDIPSGEWQYKTLFICERGSSVQFVKLDIPDSAVCVYDRDGNKTPDKAFEDLSIYDDYLKRLQQIVSDFLEYNPEVNKAIFYAPLFF